MRIGAQVGGLTIKKRPALAPGPGAVRGVGDVGVAGARRGYGGGVGSAIELGE